ncbi:hypothetical protein Tco_0601806 [Tanacetum coccineum]
MESLMQKKEAGKRLILEWLKHRLKIISYDELMEKESIGSLVLEQPKHKSRSVSSCDDLKANKKSKSKSVSSYDELIVYDELMYVELNITSCSVAVISVKRDNLILKEAFVSQKNFAEKNANKCTSVVFENKEKSIKLQVIPTL